MEVKTSVAEIEIDPKGDMIAIATYGSLEKHFKVSSHALTLACRPWAAMLKYENVLGMMQEKGSVQQRFVDDDFSTLEVLFNIAHLRFDKVPDSLEFEELLAMATLTDKYQATILVRPWAPKWTSEWCHLADDAGGEDFVWIAWEFGLHREFESIASRMALLARRDGDGICAANGLLFSLQYMPPGLIERIVEVRDAILARLLAIPYSYVASFTELHDKNYICRSQACRAECDAMAYGSLMLALHREGLWPQKTSQEYSLSVHELAETIKNLKVSFYPHFSQGKKRDMAFGFGGTDCGCTKSFQAEVQQVLNTVQKSITSVHEHHIETQRSFIS